MLFPEKVETKFVKPVEKVIIKNGNIHLDVDEKVTKNVTYLRMRSYVND